MEEKQCNGIVCPYCGCIGIGRVKDSRITINGIRRRRECQACGKRYTTYEGIAEKYWAYKNIGGNETCK